VVSLAIASLVPPRPTLPGRTVPDLSAAIVSTQFLDGKHKSDCQPSNIFVCERGGAYDVIKLLDFGLVHLEDAALAQRSEKSSAEPAARSRDKNLTQAGQLLGTPAYMAPEQIEEKQPDARSDIYSLGGVACFLLCGKPPYERDTLAELYAAQLHAPLPNLRQQLSDLPLDLEQVVMRCLAKAADERYQDIEEVGAALAAAACATTWSRAQAKAWWQTHAPTTEPPPNTYGPLSG
jgi:serine/threonine protein kinase